MEEINNAIPENTLSNTVPEAQPAETSVQVPKKKTPILFLILIPVILALLGLVAYEGYLYYQENLTAKEKVVLKPKPTAVPKIPLTLELTSPTEGSLISNNQVLVEGKTSPNTVIVVYTDANDTSLESDTNGAFSGNITLEDGINTLTVTAFGTDGEEKSVEVNLVYDKES